VKTYFIAKIAIMYCLRSTKNIAYHNPEMWVFYVDKVLVMGISGNLCAFNLVILLKIAKN